MRKDQNYSEIEKEIFSGKYGDYYITYNRKSLDEPNSQRNSIKYQRSANRKYAVDEGLPIASVTLEGFCTDGVISEKHSAFKETDELHIAADGMVSFRIERPKFQQLIQFLNRGCFKGVVCLCWDRISRNQADDTVIRKLMRSGVDVRFAYASYDDSSAGQLHMDVDGMFSRHHSRVTSEKVTAVLRQSRNEGKCTHRARIGYLNVGTMDHKPFDPDRAPVIKEMFELYATGEWSQSDLCRFAKMQGLTTVPMRPRRTKEEILADEDDEDAIESIPKVSRPITENHISRILKDPFYTGRTIGNDGTYVLSTSHEALVSDELFNRVQEILKERKVSKHYVEKIDHPLRGLVRCAYCKRVYTPYEKKGILYFNARCLKGCANKKKNCNLDYVICKIRDLIAGLHFSAEDIEVFEARLNTDIHLLGERQQRDMDKIERRKKHLREQQTYLQANRLDLLSSGAYTPDGIVAEQNRLKTELQSLQEDEQLSDEALRDTFDEIVALSELIKNVIPVYDFVQPRQKETIVRMLFSELFVAHDRLSFSLKPGLECLETRLSAVSDPTAWLSELCLVRREIGKITEALKKITNVPR